MLVPMIAEIVTVGNTSTPMPTAALHTSAVLVYQLVLAQTVYAIRAVGELPRYAPKLTPLKVILAVSNRLNPAPAQQPSDARAQ